MRDAHVIMCNDEIRGVSLGSKDEARNAMYRMEDQHFRPFCFSYKSIREYRNEWVWRIVTVKEVIPPPPVGF